MFPINPRTRLLFTGLVLLATFAALTWEHFNGGIRSHHFLGNAAFPAMHNAWAILILPALSWVASGSVEKRGLSRSVVIGFFGALLYGAALAFAFATGSTSATKAIFFLAFALSVLLPVYRAECVLGWVLGMAAVFGPFIPTFFAIVFASISALVHRVLLPVLRRAIRPARDRFAINATPKDDR
jgi:hypothetical protein